MQKSPTGCAGKRRDVPEHNDSQNATFLYFFMYSDVMEHLISALLHRFRPVGDDDAASNDAFSSFTDDGKRALGCQPSLTPSLPSSLEIPSINQSDNQSHPASLNELQVCVCVAEPRPIYRLAVTNPQLDSFSHKLENRPIKHMPLPHNPCGERDPRRR